LSRRPELEKIPPPAYRQTLAIWRYDYIFRYTTRPASRIEASPAIVLDGRLLLEPAFQLFQFPLQLRLAPRKEPGVEHEDEPASGEGKEEIHIHRSPPTEEKKKLEIRKAKIEIRKSELLAERALCFRVSSFDFRISLF
jgi:hypothetical protein